jgi:hypothetical protein
MKQSSWCIPEFQRNLLPQSLRSNFIPLIQAAHFFEIIESTCQSTQCHNTGGHNLDCHSNCPDKHTSNTVRGCHCSVLWHHGYD